MWIQYRYQKRCPWKYHWEQSLKRSHWKDKRQRISGLAEIFRPSSSRFNFLKKITGENHTKENSGYKSISFLLCLAARTPFLYKCHITPAALYLEKVYRVKKAEGESIEGNFEKRGSPAASEGVFKNQRFEPKRDFCFLSVEKKLQWKFTEGKEQANIWTPAARYPNSVRFSKYRKYIRQASEKNEIRSIYRKNERNSFCTVIFSNDFQIFLQLSTRSPSAFFSFYPSPFRQQQPFLKKSLLRSRWLKMVSPTIPRQKKFIRGWNSFFAAAGAYFSTIRQDIFSSI